ncbi:class I SAM-dependent methyltransferase [Arthrobacter sp.]|uniref:class I SAM-dependent methyltransferase n=1 Tax=Arthrobacter sp. TaxID=1667 RepID=UPI0026E00BD5|nr:class I SAM-dependent methyltransferase [Arthrobacter sp.]MDO5753004.1 class I SAM-dependent methyltransferase [Arthrobacter sp.]
MMFPVPRRIFRSKIKNSGTSQGFLPFHQPGGAMGIEESVAAHYTSGTTEQQILGRLAAAATVEKPFDPERFDVAALHVIDQLHVGGPVATARVAERAGIAAGQHVLDIGSGLGGVARYLAHHCGATVHGVELTEEFVAVATSLTRRTGLAHSVDFTLGNALSLPFDVDSFDAAVMFHVGMNIQDKDTLFGEAARVLRPGSVLAVYDVMLMGGDVEEYPLPWANTPGTSFLQPPLAYSDALAQAGFSVDFEARTPLAESAAFLEKGMTGTGSQGVQNTQFANLLRAFRAGLLAPVEIYAHLP